MEKDLTLFIKSIDKTEKTNFLSDTKFIPRLTCHLLSLFQRINHNINYRNPLLIEISVKYPLVFDITLKFYAFLREKYGYEISNDELGFIALYFLDSIQNQKDKKLNKYNRIAVICISGGILSKLTRKQISNIFQNATIKTFAFYEKNAILSFNPKLILSMIPIDHNLNVPIIYIGELLTNKDLKEIKEALFLDDSLTITKELNQFEKYSKSYIDFIKPELVEKLKTDTYENLLKKLSELVIKSRYSNEDLVENVLKREKLMSTIYKNGIAIPHAYKMSAKESTISVGIVDPPLVDRHGIVSIIFMIALSEKDRDQYSNISNDLYQLMNNDDKIRKIIDSPNYETVKSVLENIEV